MATVAERVDFIRSDDRYGFASHYYIAHLTALSDRFSPPENDPTEPRFIYHLSHCLLPTPTITSLSTALLLLYLFTLSVDFTSFILIEQRNCNMHRSSPAAELQDYSDGSTLDRLNHYLTSDYKPDEPIIRPGKHDVLLGRGGGTNSHVGNVYFRQLVQRFKVKYLVSPKAQKPNVAREVIQLWKGQQPPGRFLMRVDNETGQPTDEPNGKWIPVDDKKAREKASQCLRERTPEILPLVNQLKEERKKAPLNRSQQSPLAYEDLDNSTSNESERSNEDHELYLIATNISKNNKTSRESHQRRMSQPAESRKPISERSEPHGDRDAVTGSLRSANMLQSRRLSMPQHLSNRPSSCVPASRDAATLLEPFTPDLFRLSSPECNIGEKQQHGQHAVLVRQMHDQQKQQQAMWQQQSTMLPNQRLNPCLYQRGDAQPMMQLYSNLEQKLKQQQLHHIAQSTQHQGLHHCTGMGSRGLLDNPSPSHNLQPDGNNFMMNASQTSRVMSTGVENQEYAVLTPPPLQHSFERPGVPSSTKSKETTKATKLLVIDALNTEATSSSQSTVTSSSCKKIITPTPLQNGNQSPQCDARRFAPSRRRSIPKQSILAESKSAPQCALSVSKSYALTMNTPPRVPSSPSTPMAAKKMESILNQDSTSDLDQPLPPEFEPVPLRETSHQTASSLEDYRQQLELYMNGSKTSGVGATDVLSSLDAYNQMLGHHHHKHGKADMTARGVNRAISGMSAMSFETQRSMMSLGLNSFLSAQLTEESSSRNFSRDVGSVASLMSDVTDLSLQEDDLACE
jgi:hypothetical protein